MGSQITVREATRADIGALCVLEAECFSLPWGEKAFEDFFSNGCSRCLVAELSGKVVGYVGMNLISGEGEITNIAVTEAARGNGVATRLMDALCLTDGLVKLMLDVRVSNAPARSLYEKYGFGVDGVRKNFYSHPREDAVLMSREITG